MSERRVVVFVTVIAAALLLFYGAVGFLKASPLLTGALLLSIAGLFFLSPTIASFLEYERGVRFRFGRFKDVLGPGWKIVIPLYDTIVRVDLREQEIDVPPVKVVTSDDVAVSVDTIYLMRIKDPAKSVIAVRDYRKAVSDLITSEIRTAVSKMPLKDVLNRPEDINTALTRQLEEIDGAWGIQTTKFEVEGIVLPEELVAAMTKRQVASEVQQRTTIEAETRKISINAINQAASALTQRTMAFLYIDALKQIGQSRSTKIVLPSQLVSPDALREGIAEGLGKDFIEEAK